MILYRILLEIYENSVNSIWIAYFYPRMDWEFVSIFWNAHSRSNPWILVYFNYMTSIGYLLK